MLWSISTGSIIKCMLYYLKDLDVAIANAITWPAPSECVSISIEVAKKGFRKCVSLMDGTTLPLTQRPKVDVEVYYDQIKRYSINMQIVCNDKKKSIHMFIGEFHHIHSMVAYVPKSFMNIDVNYINLRLC